METKDVITALTALAQETRLAVFRHLVEAGPEGVTVGRIAEVVNVAPATLSFHLKELSRAGLVDSRQESRFIWYCARYPTMNELIGYLTENCCGGQPASCEIDCCPPTASEAVKASSRAKKKALT